MIVRVSFRYFEYFGCVLGLGKVNRVNAVLSGMDRCVAQVPDGDKWKSIFVLSPALLSRQGIVRRFESVGIKVVDILDTDLQRIKCTGTAVLYKDIHGSDTFVYYDRPPKGCVDSLSDLYDSMYLPDSPTPSFKESDLMDGYIPDNGFPTVFTGDDAEEKADTVDKFFETYRLFKTLDNGEAYYLSRYRGNIRLALGELMEVPTEVTNMSEVPKDAMLRGFILDSTTMVRSEPVSLSCFILKYWNV